MEADKLIIRSKTPDGVLSFDEYGFAVFSEDQADIERSHNYTSLENPSDEHQLAWERYVADWPSSYINSPNKLRYLLRKGTPRPLRPILWAKLLGCEQQQKTSSFSYSECVRAVRSQMVELGISEYCFHPHHQVLEDEDEEDTGRLREEEKERHHPAKMKHLIPLQILRQIVVDLERTFPTHRLFMGSKPEAKEGRASLFRLLSVYALYNPSVGYCQGMSYLVGMLLMVMKEEEDVFWAMVALFEKPKFLAGYFDMNLKRIQSHASLFQKLLGQRFPKVAKHFDSLGVQPLMYVTPWFMCLYTSLPCWDTILAIWDLILLDGVTTIFRVGLSLIDIHQHVILANTDLTKILPPLLHPKPEMVLHEILIPAVWKMNVEKWEIETLQAIVAEEEDPVHSGKKRRHQAEKTFGEVSQNSKRIRLEEKPKPAATSSFFQRVINIFTPQNQRDNELPGQGSSVTTSRGQHRQDTRHSHRLIQKGPGAARPARHRSSSKVKELSEGGSASGKAMKGGSGWNAASKEDLASSRKRMEQDDGCEAQERRTRSGFTALGSGQTRKESAMTDTSNSGRRRTPRKVPVEEDRVVFKGLRQVPLTPRSAGRSKLFGRLHAQVFGSEEPQGPPLSHPLEDPASPERRRRTPTKARRSLAKSPKQQQRTSPRVSTRSQRPPSRSSWLSPYCKQYMVNPAHKARHQTPLQKLHHINNAKDLHLSPPRSATPELDFDHVASPIRGTLDKENSPAQTVSLDGQVRSAPSMESLESTPDGVLSVLGEQNSQAWREMRSPLSERYSTLNENNNSLFKTPSHPMHLRPKQFTPGMYSARTPRSEERHLVGWQNPMNMPSARRLVCRSAKAQHSFKMFHTPTPVRQSKVLDLHQSPNLSSPEVELMTMCFGSPTATLNLSGMKLDD
ncbi:USP6 N-terminal-like protein isoform X2 [Strongylocentrotus purpuratus]|uniref:Rab-GAP TBC domain-containing protein n=1 Tax=Strongylocentrotus purpuratus TaxID=7668 RepID=A0A7M7P2Z8_STRPU|nr:USP6 N-terminal-like protein isoform X2 [Strongylocentrotus purpuratus]